MLLLCCSLHGVRRFAGFAVMRALRIWKALLHMNCCRGSNCSLAF